MTDSVRDLKQLERLLRALEQEPEGNLPASSLEEIREFLLRFENHPRIEIAKLVGMRDHLRTEMSSRTLANFLVPVERALERNIRDDDFLIADRDTRASTTREILPLRWVLDHWRSAFNVGSAFRSADGLGIEKIHLTGYTPTPDSPKAAKAALGTEAWIPWEHEENTARALGALKAAGYRLIALETTSHAVPLENDFPEGPTAFVFGNERFGLGSEVLGLCDEVRILPLNGAKNSMNAAVVAALAAYEWRRQRGEK